MNANNKPKLLVFVPKFPVSTETFIEREISCAQSRGNLDVCVFSIAKSNGYLSENLASKIIYNRISWKSAPLVFLRSVVNLFVLFPQVINSLSLWTKSPRSYSLSKIIYMYIRVLGHFVPIVKTIKPDFMLVHFLAAPSTDFMLVSRLLNIPYGISAHARDVFTDSEYVDSKIKTANFISICNRRAYESCVEQAKSQGASKNNLNKIILRYHGLDLNYFVSYAKTLQRNDADTSKVLKLFNNGRITEKKGQTYLIEACELLKEKGIPFSLTIAAGGGDLTAVLKDEIAKRNLTSFVTILNDGKPVPFTQLVDYYFKSDIFVFPAINTNAGDSDGIANVLVEAAVSKLPIIATDAGATCEFLTNQQSALLVAQKDPKALCHAIETLYKDQTLCARLTESAFSKVLQEFDINKNMQELENMILSIVPGKDVK